MLAASAHGLFLCFLCPFPASSPPPCPPLSSPLLGVSLCSWPLSWVLPPEVGTRTSQPSSEWVLDGSAYSKASRHQHFTSHVVDFALLPNGDTSFPPSQGSLMFRAQQAQDDNMLILPREKMTQTNTTITGCPRERPVEEPPLTYWLSSLSRSQLE